MASRIVLWAFAVLILVQMPVFARSSEWQQKEQAAAKALHVPDLRLVDPSGLDSTSRNILERSGVILGYVERATTMGRYGCTALGNSQKRETVAAVMAEALDKLSPQSLQKIGLRYILMCGSASARNQEIGGIPVPPIHTLMLSLGLDDNEYRQHIFYHELFHFMELTAKDRQFVSQWDRDFSSGYGRGSGTSWRLKSGDRGFVSAYAQTSAEEDRAEIFAHLMRAPDEMRRFANSDWSPELNGKIEAIQKFSVTNFDIRYVENY
ncbi:MAG: hypothetical protein ACK4VI_08165 [Alphaproteobacteria bacterium]